MITLIVLSYLLSFLIRGIILLVPFLPHLLTFYLLPYLLIMCKKKKEKESDDSDDEMKTAVVPEEKVEEQVEKKAAIEPKKKKEYTSKYKDPKADSIWKTRQDSSRQKKERINKEFKMARGIYEGHKCTNPEKNRLADETCEICAAYIEWAGDQYDRSSFTQCPDVIKRRLEEDLFDYQGKLPESLEHPEWVQAKLRMENEGKKVQKPVAEAKKMTQEEFTKYEEDAEAIRNCGQQLSQCIKEPKRNCGSLEYQTGYGNVKEEYEKVHKIYSEHKCHYRPSKEEGCLVCHAFIGWIETHYKYSLGEKSYPPEIKKKLEEHLYDHDGNLPSWIEKRDWARAKKRIREKRQWPEEEKRLAQTQKSEMEHKSEKTAKSTTGDVKDGQKPSSETH